MTDSEDYARPAPASAAMAEKLAVNRTGRLTRGQRRTVAVAGCVTLALLLCPLALLIQLGALLLSEGGTLSAGAIVAGVAVLLFFAIFAGIVSANVRMFVPEAFAARPVRWARGPLRIQMSEKDRPELPFSYVIDDYSFAPYVAPPDVAMRPGAPYLVYYSARSRLLLSMFALDAPDADRWLPESDNPPR